MLLMHSLNKGIRSETLCLRNPIDQFRRFDPTFKPDPDKVYFVHADLAQQHDKCAVAIAHVDKWVNIQVIKDYEQVAPIVVVDAVAWWEPRVEGPVDLSEVKQWIQNLEELDLILAWSALTAGNLLISKMN
jgi:hypothetical protein